MATRDDESHEDKESRDEEGAATDGNGDDERPTAEHESGGDESNGDGGDDSSGDDDSGGDDDDTSDDKSSDDDKPSRDKSRDDDQRTAPAYSFSGAESSGEAEGAGTADSGGDDEDEDEDSRSKMPVTAATTQWHPSREDQKKAKRQEREQHQAEEEKRGKRNKRLKLIGAAVAAALLIVLIAIGISSMGGEEADTAGVGDVEGPAVGADAVKARFDGIEQDGMALGDPKAPVTLIEYADLQCPFCKDASNNTLPALVDRYVKTGKLRIEFRNYAILGPDSKKAARALEGAADQNKAWQFIDLWFLNQGEENSGYVNDEFIRKIAQGAGLDPDAVIASANDLGNDSKLDEVRSDAEGNGIKSTPSYLIGRTGEELAPLQIQDANNPELFAQSIDRIAAQQE